MEHKEFPESEMKATADDNKPAGCFSEESCESASADAVKETDPECGKEIYWAFLPPEVRRRTVCLCLHHEYCFVVMVR